ncbi:MAG TPA: 4Fe-4S dicluster domain-containing protein, partial [Caldilineaceae bacterium]|nr:4Fe-4S dicluster domain-containing protein [Caldilineaceae bacterium]
MTTQAADEQQLIERSDFHHLFDALRVQGYTIVGPTVRDGAIVYAELQEVADLPIGWTDEQEGGHYRLQQIPEQTLFGYTLGPHSWKQFLQPPVVRLWQAARRNGTFEIEAETESPPLYAFLGVRACELHAIQIQDRIFLEGHYVDPIYRARREPALIIAVNCGRAGNTCFCASTATGPQVARGYDLALTEVLTAERHYFVVVVGTDRGADLIAAIPHRAATTEESAAAAAIVAATATHMGRTLETDGLRERLYRKLDDPHWESVANRCLTCGNCTMVCPTCFCTSTEDVSDLSGEHAERWLHWASC